MVLVLVVLVKGNYSLRFLLLLTLFVTLFSSNPHSTIHDKLLAFNIIKKKIRTVLSKTDLHSGDFRHTTVSLFLN